MKNTNKWFWDTHPKAMALSATLGSIYVVCLLALVLFPQGAMSFFGSWFHGVDLQKIAVPSTVSVQTLFALVTLMISTYLVGLLYGYFRQLCIWHCEKRGWI